MTQQDFRVFIDSIHGGNFPGFSAWFFAKDRKEPAAATQQRALAWFQGLKHASLDEVQGASLEILYGTEKPEGYTNHLAALREGISRMRARNRESGAQAVGRSYGCQLCKDTGLVEVTARPGLCLFTLQRTAMPNGTWTAVDCTCGRGAAYSDDFKGPRRDRYDERRMELRPEVDQAKSWRLIEEMHAKGERRKANAWDAFLNGGVLPLREVVLEPGEEP
jgi:hypothetical protein